MSRRVSGRRNEDSTARSGAVGDFTASVSADVATRAEDKGSDLTGRLYILHFLERINFDYNVPYKNTQNVFEWPEAQY